MASLFLLPGVCWRAEGKHGIMDETEGSRNKRGAALGQGPGSQLLLCLSGCGVTGGHLNEHLWRGQALLSRLCRVMCAAVARTHPDGSSPMAVLIGWSQTLEIIKYFEYHS